MWEREKEIEKIMVREMIQREKRKTRKGRETGYREKIERQRMRKEENKVNETERILRVSENGE